MVLLPQFRKQLQFQAFCSSRSHNRDSGSRVFATQGYVDFLEQTRADSRGTFASLVLTVFVSSCAAQRNLQIQSWSYYEIPGNPFCWHGTKRSRRIARCGAVCVDTLNAFSCGEDLSGAGFFELWRASQRAPALCPTQKRRFPQEIRAQMSQLFATPQLAIDWLDEFRKKSIIYESKADIAPRFVLDGRGVIPLSNHATNRKCHSSSIFRGSGPRKAFKCFG